MRIFYFESRRPRPAHTSIICAILLVFFAVPGGQALFAQEEIAAPPTADPTRPESSDAASQQLIRNFLTVVGGAEAYNRIQNVVARGTLVEAGKAKSFELIETQDGQRLLQLSWRHLGREYQEKLVFDGLRAWRQALSPERREAEDYSGQESIHFSRQRWVLQPFVLPSVASYTFKYQGGARVTGRKCHVIIGFGKKDERSWFYFDQEKFLLLRWGGFGEIAGVREYMDYRATQFKRVDGVLFPSAIDLLAENAAYGRIEFDSILTNQDIDQARFVRPENQTPVLRQRSRLQN